MTLNSKIGSKSGAPASSIDVPGGSPALHAFVERALERLRTKVPSFEGLIARSAESTSPGEQQQNDPSECAHSRRMPRQRAARPPDQIRPTTTDYSYRITTRSRGSPIPATSRADRISATRSRLYP